MECFRFCLTRLRLQVSGAIFLTFVVGFSSTAFSQFAGQTQYGNFTPQVRGFVPPIQSRDSPTPTSILQYAFKPLYEDDSHLFPRLPGEFEPQNAILLSVSDLMYQHNGVLTQIVEKTSRRVPLVILYNDEKQLVSTVELLDSLSCDLNHVSLYNLKLDTIWLRDFGPRIAESSQRTVSLDFFYDGQRPLDDRFPTAWGQQANADINRVEWTLHGGNLLTNGKGLALASSRLFEDNFIAFPNPTPGMDIEFERRKIVVDGFKKDCNINQLLILEPVQPEATKHVDMFAAFLAPDQVLLAQVEPRQDPANAKVLDYNAKLLEQVKVDGKPMRVERIPIPPRNGKYWSPYTNIILANNTVLMPVYDSDPPEIVRAAVSVYQKLLPGFHVETVDMTSMQKLEGALHCMSVNVPKFAELPRGVFSFADAKTRIKTSGYVAKEQEYSNHENPRQLKDNVEVAANPESAEPQIQDQDDPSSRQRKSQLAAVATYRRSFVDQSRQFTVDAYAVGIESGAVVLLRAEDGREIQVEIESLCREDKLWLSANVNKIGSNGAKVRDFVKSNL